MKKRNGFVSNSSSASFIVFWKNRLGCARHEDPIMDVKEAIDILFEGSSASKIRKELIAGTEHIGGGVFKTTDGTSMMNTMADFRPSIAYLVAALTVNGPFELVRTEVEDDN